MRYRFLQRFALAIRNILVLTRSVGHARRRLASIEWEQRRVHEELALGVSYVIGARVEGEIAEFGTQWGMTASAIAKALAQRGGKKRFHLFDSFQGLPNPATSVDKDSPQVQSGIWVGGALTGLSPAQLRRVVAKHIGSTSVFVHEGWFEDTLQDIGPDTKFAMIHVDSDLYESARQVLTSLFSNKKVSEGCVIFFDDFDCNRASPIFGERRAWREAVEEFGIEFSDGGEYSWAGHKYYVHSYA